MSPTIRLLTADDTAVLSRVGPDVFDNPIDPILTAEFLADPRHHIIVAIDDDVVVGMATAVHYIHPDKPRELWINEVGVASTHRNQGIAKAMMRTLLTHGRSIGCTEAWLGTEPENTAARRMYAAVGGAEEPMVYVTFAMGEDDT